MSLTDTAHRYKSLTGFAICCLCNSICCARYVCFANEYLYHIETDRRGGYIEFAARQIYRAEPSEAYRMRIAHISTKRSKTIPFCSFFTSPKAKLHLCLAQTSLHSNFTFAKGENFTHTENLTHQQIKSLKINRRIYLISNLLQGKYIEFEPCENISNARSAYIDKKEQNGSRFAPFSLRQRRKLHPSRCLIAAATSSRVDAIFISPLSSAAPRKPLKYRAICLRASFTAFISPFSEIA